MDIYQYYPLCVEGAQGSYKSMGEVGGGGWNHVIRSKYL